MRNYRENYAFKSCVIDTVSLARVGFVIYRHAIDCICSTGQRWAHFSSNPSDVINNLIAKIDHVTLACSPSNVETMGI